MEKTYIYKMYPNKQQEELIQKTFGCCRFIYNYFLNKKKNLYRDFSQNISFNECCRELTLLKNENDWLREPDKCALQNSLKNLFKAYDMFYKFGYGYPKFKTKKDYRQSYRTQNYNKNTILVSNNRIKLPKLGFVKIRNKQIPEGRILNATIIYDSDGMYYVHVCCTDIKPVNAKKTNKSVGIDLGISNFATYSDNRPKTENMKFCCKAEEKLSKLHGEMDRKVYGSNNWNKARIKLTKLYKKISNQKKDFLQKLTTELVNEYDVICIEDLNVSDMIARSNVKNKYLNDVSFYEFRRQLEYKCKWYGKKLIVVDHYYPSSQICNICGTRDGKKTLDIRSWTCKVCGATHDRDINAAINILKKGLEM